MQLCLINFCDIDSDVVDMLRCSSIALELSSA